MLVDGRSIQHSITIPEGLTSEQILAAFRRTTFWSEKCARFHARGRYCDTYRFERGTTREQIVSRMEQAQRRIVQENLGSASPDIPIRSPQDLVILASIVEKETGRADERTRVAAVFINRLNGACGSSRIRRSSTASSVAGYARRGILASEIRQPTPYNTYVINGLPPGPIANPGRAAMEAVANPSRTRDLFFVADGTGGHAFAKLRTAPAERRALAADRARHGSGSGRCRRTAGCGSSPGGTCHTARAARGQPPAANQPQRPAGPRADLPAADELPANASAFVIPRAALEVFGAPWGRAAGPAG